MTPKNWPLNAYSNDTWTDVVGEPAILAAILIANTTASTTVSVELRLEDAGVEKAIVLPATEIAPGPAQVLDLRSLCITGTQALQVRAAAAGINVLASGAV